MNKNFEEDVIVLKILENKGHFTALTNSGLKYFHILLKGKTNKNLERLNVFTICHIKKVDKDSQYVVNVRPHLHMNFNSSNKKFLTKAFEVISQETLSSNIDFNEMLKIIDLVQKDHRAPMLFFLWALIQSFMLNKVDVNVSSCGICGQTYDLFCFDTVIASFVCKSCFANHKTVDEFPVRRINVLKFLEFLFEKKRDIQHITNYLIDNEDFEKTINTIHRIYLNINS